MKALMPLALEVKRLSKSFADHLVLDAIDLSIPAQGLTAIVGLSGAGKSVLLKCIAGIESVNQGQVQWFDSVAGQQYPIDLVKGKTCSYLFQGNALMDSMTIAENLSLPLEQTTTLNVKDIQARVHEVALQFELVEALSRYPNELSGGMQKRTALARAMVVEPKVVLFDEPTAGLDPLRRNAVFEMIMKFRRQFGFTAVVVTHDLPEALVASDQIVFLHEKRVVFSGTPAEFAVSQIQAVRDFSNSLSQLKMNVQNTVER
jgi:phospholipid/cholesterol/gamma-HCH transport system ATP-binding protein